jgi:hypothetical protein
MRWFDGSIIRDPIFQRHDVGRLRIDVPPLIDHPAPPALPYDTAAAALAHGRGEQVATTSHCNKPMLQRRRQAGGLTIPKAAA